MRVESTSFRDRTVRLQFFGVLTVVGGAIWILIGLAPLLTLFGRIAPASDTPSQLMSLVTHLLLGAALIGVGVGSIRRRRWVQPIMLIVAWTWLIGGVLTVALVIPLLDNLLALGTAAGERPSPVVEMVFKVTMIVITVAGGILLPALYVWAYREPDVLTTCEVAHPASGWTERCPPTVLGLSVLLGAAAVLGVPMALKPVVPWFGVLITGWSGALLILVAAGVTAWLARATYRMSPVGWWATTLGMVLAGISIGVTFVRVEPSAYYRALGLPVEQAALLDHPWMRPMLVGGTVALTLLSVAYMVAIRRHFARPAV